jgi:hypothetical protein
MGQPLEHHVTATLKHPTDGRPCRRSSATAPCAGEPAATSCASRVLHHRRRPVMAGHHRGVVTRHLRGQGPRGLGGTSPSRRWAVSWCASRRCTPSSRAIGSGDRLRPRPYRHRLHTVSAGCCPANRVSGRSSTRG